LKAIFCYCVVDVGPTMKLKRPEVLRMYSDTIDAFYADLE